MKPRSSRPPTPSEPTFTGPGKESPPLSSQEETHQMVSSSESLTDSDLPSTLQPKKEIDSFLEDLHNLPEIRQEQITMIQESIKRGVYSVSSEQLADKIIQELQPPSQESPPSTTS